MMFRFGFSSGRSRGTVIGGGSEPSPVAVTVTPNRSDGAAPQTIQFNARATTVTGLDEYQINHWCVFDFDFGDVGAGTWSATGASKESESGAPLAGHIYETDGTKTCTVTCTVGIPWATGLVYPVGAVVRQGGATYECATWHVGGTFATDLSAERWVLFDAGMLSGEGSCQVALTTEAARWPTTQTIYYDPTGTYASAPAGCVQTTSKPASASNQRVLVADGTTFNNIDLSAGHTNQRWRAWPGTGAKPNTTGDCNIGATGRNSSNTSWLDCEDTSIIGIRVGGNFFTPAGCSRLMLLRCDRTGTGADSVMGIESDSLISYWGDPANYTSWASAGTDVQKAREVHVVECTITGASGSDAPYFGITGDYGPGSWVGGNTVHTMRQHGTRFYDSHELLTTHNRVYNPGSAQHCYKHQSGSMTVAYTDAYGTQKGYISDYCVTRGNWFGASTDSNGEQVSIRPENATPDDEQLISNLVFEANTVVLGASGIAYVSKWVGTHLTERGNVPSNDAFNTDNSAGFTLSLDGFNPASPGGNYSNLETYLSGVGITSLELTRNAGRQAT